MTQRIIAAIPSLTPAEMQGVLDHAAGQSDRWLLLATACAFAVCLVIAVVFLTKWTRSMADEMRQDRREDRQILGSIIDKNTVALTRVCDRLDRAIEKS